MGLCPNAGAGDPLKYNVREGLDLRLIDEVWEVLVATGVMIVIYLIPVWFFSMNDYEKELFKSPLRKILRKR